MHTKQTWLFAAVLLASGGCVDGPLGPEVEEPDRAFSVAPSTDAYDLSFGGTLLGAPTWDAFLTADGYQRIADPAYYERFRATVGPLLDAWAADPRLALDPNFVAAVLVKESGFDSLAVSWYPANGYPQLTHVADLDLRWMAGAPGWEWMAAEVESWPRDPRIHSFQATRSTTLSLLETGGVSAANEYFFDPVLSTRGAVFWLRLLVNLWTTDESPGGFGSVARERLNGGAPLTNGQLFDLVAVSYNQGYGFVYDHVSRYGSDWLWYVSGEAVDYLESIRRYYALFTGAGAGTGTDGGGDAGSGDGGGSDGATKRPHPRGKPRK